MNLKSIFQSKTECVRRPDPPNGKIKCDSKRYAAGKSCYLQCDTGFIPLGRTFMTCEEDPDTGPLNLQIWLNNS